MSRKPKPAELALKLMRQYGKKLTLLDEEKVVTGHIFTSVKTIKRSREYLALPLDVLPEILDRVFAEAIATSAMPVVPAAVRSALLSLGITVKEIEALPYDSTWGALPEDEQIRRCLISLKR